MKHIRSTDTFGNIARAANLRPESLTDSEIENLATLTPEMPPESISALVEYLLRQMRDTNQQLAQASNWAQEATTIARTDALTELSNFRGLFESASGKIDQLRHQPQSGSERRVEGPDIKSLTIACLDVDDFKGINDKYGHQVGDKVLRAIGRFLKKNTRKNDILARPGGDEFTLVLINDSDGQGLAKLESGFGSLSFDSLGVEHEGKDISVGISMGAVEVNAKTISQYLNFEEILRVADQGLYNVKRAWKTPVPAEKIAPDVK